MDGGDEGDVSVLWIPALVSECGAGCAGMAGASPCVLVSVLWAPRPPSLLEGGRFLGCARNDTRLRSE